jgi:hypothetical protein
LLYSWSCLPSCPDNVDAYFRSFSGSKFTAKASTLATEVQLFVRVTITTFLGASSISQPLHIYIRPSPLPSVSISPSTKTLQRQDFLELTALTVFASCTVDFESIVFSWSVKSKAPLSDTVLRLIQTMSQSVLLLQPYDLIGGYDYEFSVSIKKGSLQNSADVSVRVLPGKLTAVIDGGSRTVSIRNLISLDGSQSVDFDANLGIGERLDFCWTCRKVQGIDLVPCQLTNGTPFHLSCSKIIQFSLQNIATSSVDRFMFSLILQSSSGRSASDSVILSLSSDHQESLDVYVRSSCVANICKISDSITLATNASLSFSYKWTLEHSPKLIGRLDFDSSNSFVSFQPMQLPPGNYEFRCVITDSQQSSGQSSIKFQVVPSPHGGSCSYTLPESPSTTTLVSCSGWNTLFPPLR